jgi:pyruvate/2-oxoacid:ferredoxin oxidoreductase beta subunit
MPVEVEKQFLPLFEIRSDARHFQPDLPVTDPYVAGHRTCAGCGPAIEYKLTLKAAGDNSIAVGPTGCMYVANASYLCTPYSIPWAHVAIASSGSFTSGVAAGYEAMIRKGKYKGEYPNIIVMAGDGSSSDIGLGPMSGALYRNHDALFICYDNEQYANTGIQVSPMTPYGGMTTFTPPGKAIPEGKKLWPKQLAKMMAAGHPQAYVATASIGYAMDFMNKVRKGLNYKGAAFVHVYTPCQKGFVYETPNTIDLGRAVVECGMFQMWEYDPETRTYEFFIPERMIPVIEYLKGQGRFGHLKAEHVAKLQNYANRNWREMGVEVPAEFVRMATAEGEKDMAEAVKAAPLAASPIKIADRARN